MGASKRLFEQQELEREPMGNKELRDYLDVILSEIRELREIVERKEKGDKDDEANPAR